VIQPDHYLLGCSDAEEARLERQSAALAPKSDAQFERIGLTCGQRPRPCVLSLCVAGLLNRSSRDLATPALLAITCRKSPCSSLCTGVARS